MNRHRLLGSVVGALVLGACCTLCQAGITTYTSESAFLSALEPGYYTENFAGYGAGEALPSPQSFSGGAFAYDIAAAQGLYGESFTTPALFGSNLNDDPLVFTITSGNVTGIGGYFYYTDINNNFLSTVVDLTVVSSGGSLATSYTPTSIAGSFIGFTTTDPTFTSLTMAATPSSNGTDYYNSVSTLTVGTPSPVPEPSSLLQASAAVAMGLSGWLVRRRFARRSAVSS